MLFSFTPYRRLFRGKSIATTAVDGSPSIRAAAAGANDYQVNYDVGCIVDSKFMPGVGKPKPKEENKPQPGYWPCVLDEIGATYTSIPLAQSIRVTGTPTLDLVLRLNAPDVNIFAYLETVASDNKVTIISHGRLKASARKLSTAPYDNLGNGWHSNRRRDAQQVTPGELFEMQLELSPTSIQIPGGTRLRLTITGADLRQRNLEQIKVLPPPIISIQTGSGGSSLGLPIMQQE